MKHHLFTISLFILYILFMTAGMIWQGVGIAPDRYMVVLLVGTLVITKKTRAFLFDWIPFLMILLSYDYLRGWADNLSMRIHYEELIHADMFVFGTLPTVQLQSWFYQAGQLHWYDYLAMVMYFLHFALPLSFGYILWIYRRIYFREFITGLVVLSYAALMTFVLFPAAPPWMASQEGRIPHIEKIMDHTFEIFPDKLNVPTIYQQFNPNPVAAMPSLHAAYPFLVLLFAIRFFGKRGLFFSPYVIFMWLSIVYLGEHYVIDVVVGGTYAFLSFYLTQRVFHNPVWHKKVSRFLKSIPIIGQQTRLMFENKDR